MELPDMLTLIEKVGGWGVFSVCVFTYIVRVLPLDIKSRSTRDKMFIETLDRILTRTDAVLTHMHERTDARVDKLSGAIDGMADAIRGCPNSMVNAPHGQRTNDEEDMRMKQNT